MMALTFIIALAASPLYGSFLFAQERAIVIDELRSSLEEARLRSMLGKGDASWGVVLDGADIVLFRGGGYPGSGDPSNEKYAIRGRVTVSGLGEVVFTRVTGQPGTEPTIVVSDDWGSNTFTLNGEGVLDEVQ